jgi:hypothetical protein
VIEETPSYSEIRIKTGYGAAYFTPEAICFFTGVICIQKQSVNIYHLHLQLPSEEDSRLKKKKKTIEIIKQLGILSTSMKS